jgi:aryl-alcohol dehydrogenase-like predicted oxidoreductase
MQYATLGNTGLVVSRLAFGAMTFTSGNKAIGAVYKTDASTADALVGRALDAGVNFFDTADTYAGGQSEEILGAALRPRRNEIVLATKVGFRTGEPLLRSGLTRRHILWSVDQSLKRLQSDWIDVYIVHREDRHTPLEETLAALDSVVRAGKVRYLGFSNWSAWRVAAAMELQRANGWAAFSHGQMYYSLLGRDVERDVIPMMRHYGLGMTIWSPLAAGFLSGKYTRENLSNPEHRYAGFDLLPFDKDHGFRLVDRMRPIAQRHQATVAQVALGWLLAKKAVSSVILGASKPSQLDDNLGVDKLRLTEAEVAELDGATVPPAVYPNWFVDRMADEPVQKALNQ